MRASFEAAGFVEPHARYTIETEEPFGAVTGLGQADEPYVILVHQDVRCDLGYTIDDLEQRLEELTALDDKWAIAGNAGADIDHQIWLHLDEPPHRFRSSELPHRVVTLDENMLILRTDRAPRCSTALSGFHLYGADTCLNAAEDGSSCYVIDFPVTHLSHGSENGRKDAMRRFCKHWSRFPPRYLRVTWGVLVLSGSRVVRRALYDPLIRRRFVTEDQMSPSTQRVPLDPASPRGGSVVLDDREGETLL